MPCLLGLIALSAPRVVLALVFLFSNYLGRAYHSALWPFLGFLFAPLTTLAYAWVVNSHGPIEGMYLAVIVVAALVDFGLLGGVRRK